VGEPLAAADPDAAGALPDAEALAEGSIVGTGVGSIVGVGVAAG
jgi:hypothetical protein